MQEKDHLLKLRNTTEHVLHTAMQELYPDLIKVMGPAIEDGFYMDFDVADRITPEDFEKIEARMHELVKANLPVKKIVSTYEDAKKKFAKNPYKLEFIKEIEEAKSEITYYEMGDRDLDLCSGPHLESTGKVGAFKLLSVAGAYWRGDEKNKMLQRIYGTVFDTKEELDAYLNQLEEAKKRDHRKLGKELDLFVFSDEVGGGLPLWTPNGTIIREELENWAKETEAKLGYKRVATPHIAKHTLFEISGHLPYYRDDMYSPMMIDGEEYFLKGMNCPHHHMIFKASPKSYRDLPLKYAEYGTVYRYEQSGTLFGLMRVRSICQNDAHIYTTLETAEEEFLKSLELYDFYYQKLGLKKSDYSAVIGLRDPENLKKYHGDEETWALAEKMTRSAVEKFGISYVDDLGGAAFYGPKIDVGIKSSTGKVYNISTAQLDLFMPKKFNLEYTDRDGTKKLCAVIHRAPLGSHERFIGFLIEHFAGAFPVWLAPQQIAVLPISDKHLDYANMINAQMLEAGLRSQIDDRKESLSAKIRDNQAKKVPYMLIVGDKEAQSETVTVRFRSSVHEDVKDIKYSQFIEVAKGKYLTKSLDLW